MGKTMGITMGENFVGYFATFKWDINILLVLWNMNFIFPIQLGISSSQLTFIFFRGWLNHQPGNYGYNYGIIKPLIVIIRYGIVTYSSHWVSYNPRCVICFNKYNYGISLVLGFYHH